MGRQVRHEALVCCRELQRPGGEIGGSVRSAEDEGGVSDPLQANEDSAPAAQLGAGAQQLRGERAVLRGVYEQKWLELRHGFAQVESLARCEIEVSEGLELFEGHARDVLGVPGGSERVRREESCSHRICGLGRTGPDWERNRYTCKHTYTQAQGRHRPRHRYRNRDRNENRHR